MTRPPASPDGAHDDLPDDEDSDLLYSQDGIRTVSFRTTVGWDPLSRQWHGIIEDPDGAQIVSEEGFDTEAEADAHVVEAMTRLAAAVEADIPGAFLVHTPRPLPVRGDRPRRRPRPRRRMAEALRRLPGPPQACPRHPPRRPGGDPVTPEDAARTIERLDATYPDGWRSGDRTTDALTVLLADGCGKMLAALFAPRPPR